MNLLAAGSNSRKRVGCRPMPRGPERIWTTGSFAVIVLVVPGSAASIASAPRPSADRSSGCRTHRQEMHAEQLSCLPVGFPVAVKVDPFSVRKASIRHACFRSSRISRRLPCIEKVVESDERRADGSGSSASFRPAPSCREPSRGSALARCSCASKPRCVDGRPVQKPQ